jgi:hypothetical protein
MQVTNKEISNFRQIGDLFVRNTSHYGEKSKLWYAVDKMLKRTEKKMQRAIDKQQDIRRDTALTEGKDKRLLIINNEFQYTREGAAERDKKLHKLWNEELVEIEPHLVSVENLPMDDNDKVNLEFEFEGPRGPSKCSHYEAKQAFTKFVIEPTEDDEEEEESTQSEVNDN